VLLALVHKTNQREHRPCDREELEMNEAAIEAAIRTLGREATDIKNITLEQSGILRRIVDHEDRLINILEKILKG
jgi:hypothetical protein